MLASRSKLSYRRGRQIPDGLLVLALVAIAVGLMLPAVPKVREAAARQRVKAFLEDHYAGTPFQFEDVSWGHGQSHIKLRAKDVTFVVIERSTTSALDAVLREDPWVDSVTVSVYRLEDAQPLFEAVRSRVEARWTVTVPFKGSNE
jgi:hypothetical protein